MVAITLKQLLENSPRDLFVESLNITVQVRDPTTQDKIEVREDSKKHPLWNEMNPLEQATEITNRLALRILVEPKISYEDYEKCPSPKIDAILEAVTWDYSKRVREFTGHTRKEIRDFLEEQKESSLKSSTSS